MVYSNVEFFNVAELRPTADGGYDMLRFPKGVYENMHDMGSKMAHIATGVEIRFVTDADVVWITLGSRMGGSVYLYSGDYKRQEFNIPAGGKVTITAEPMKTLSSRSEKELEGDVYKNRYSLNVYRIVIPNSYVSFYEIKPLNGTFIRPPRAEELPKKCMLMYGSSISHGCWANNYMLGYTGIAAEILGIDMQNKGMSGSSRFEKNTAEYLAGEDFDIALMELATNMTNPADYTTDEVVERVDFAVRTMCEKNPDKKIVCMSPFIHMWGREAQNDRDEHKIELVNALERLISSYSYKNLTYISSEKIFDRGYYCCYDICHPSDFGHIRMGYNLANILKDII